MEEIFEPLYDISTNLDDLRFKQKFSFSSSKTRYARILTHGLGEIHSKDIIIPHDIILFKDQPLLYLISDNLCINFILKIILRLLTFGNVLLIS